MAITSDGSQLFGITTATFGTDTLVVESFTLTSGSNRVDLDDGNGEPLGSKTVPGRQEVSMTCQVGDSLSTDIIPGGEIAYAASGGTIVITEAALAETQADYQRWNISGYVKINS
jgi:hypothetical protein